ncbi:MAG TPA: hypothetical protein VEL74_03440 [Thermoanaerobaculia bacterium]|nr:hypothetical protein [Thermoanaerobaculia bacterium]
MNRRELLKSLAGSVASYALFRTVFTRDAFAAAVQPVTSSWLKGLHEMSLDLKTGTITPGQWQARIQELFNRVDAAELIAAIDFGKLTQGFEYPDQGVNTKWVKFPKLAGLPADLAFYSKIFGMKRDRAIIPHGHRNMVSCHYVLQGELRLRHYDKVEEDGTHMVIEPTVDQAAPVGSHSSISDERNNIHWLRAATETAFTYDVLIVDLQGKKWEVDNIDPHGAEKIAGGRLRVRKLGLDEALRKYGHEAHHHT